MFHTVSETDRKEARDAGKKFCAARTEPVSSSFRFHAVSRGALDLAEKRLEARASRTRPRGREIVHFHVKVTMTTKQETSLNIQETLYYDNSS